MIDLAAKPVLEVLPGPGRDLPPPREKQLWEQRGAGCWGTSVAELKPLLVHPWQEQCYRHQQNEAHTGTLLPLSLAGDRVSAATGMGKSRRVSSW